MSKRLLVVVFLLGLVVAACSSDSSDSDASGPERDTIRIGVEGPLSGPQGAYGEGMVDGARFAADRINEAGGLDGVEIEIVPIDDGADADKGVAAAKKAIDEGLDAVVGPYNSSVGVKTLPLYEEAGVVAVRFTTADSTEGFGVTVQPMTSQIAPVATRALQQWLGATKVSLVYDSTETYTVDANTAMKESLAAAGITVVADVAIEPGESSYAAAVDQALAAGPDAIYVITYYPEGGVIARDLAGRNAGVKCLADYSAFDDEYIKAAGPAGVKACPVVGLPGLDDFPGSESLVPAFREAFGSEPGSQAPFAYDAVQVLAEAAGSKAGFARAKLTAALFALEGYEGWTGSITFEEGTGNRVPALVVVDSVNAEGILGIDQSWAATAGASAG